MNSAQSNFLSSILAFLAVILPSPSFGQDYASIGSPSDEVHLKEMVRTYDGIDHDRYRVKLSAVENPTPEDKTVTIEYYKSRRVGPTPVVIIPPNLEGVTILERSVAYYLSIHGFNALVYHPSFAIKDTSRKTQQTNDFFKSAVWELKKIVDWVQTRPDEFDKERVGLFGMSLGGILSSVILGQDSRIHGGYLIVPGGDLPSIFAQSDADYFKEYRRVRMEDEGIADVPGLEAALRANLTIDPLKPSIKRNPEELYMLLGSADTLVP